MLLEFKAKNYKSFKDELIFSMIPAPKQKGLDYSILKSKIEGKSYKGLSSAVIYGPNASGKTNIIGAMDTFKNIVLRGNIKNAEGNSKPNDASYQLELIPFCSNKKNDPIEFKIKFIDNGLVVEYCLSMDIGSFLSKNFKRRIITEILLINEKKVFDRNSLLEINNLNVIGKYLNVDIDKISESAKDIARNGLNCEELFLNNGFKNIYSNKLVSLIMNWLDEKFMVIYRADALIVKHKIKDIQKDIIYIEETLNKAAKIFGVNSNEIGFKADEDGSDVELCSVFKKEKYKTTISADVFESYGTVRFLNEFPLIIRALIIGSTLVIDEFDASIHPMALMNIINIFHNDEINKNKAQLIFNTHNPIFLNKNLYRRDEIKFVERSDQTYESIHYSLSDFKTSGKSSVRKEDDYMDKYFLNRYGAIKDIDFSTVIEELINSTNEVDNE